MTMTIRSCAALALIAALSAPAAALSITNNDETAYTVAVTAGEQQSESALASGQSFDTACADGGCVVTLIGNDGVLDEIDAVDADKLVIVQGTFQKGE